MKVTVGLPYSTGPEPRSFASSLAVSLLLHGALVLWVLASAWLFGRQPPYRLAEHTVFLAGDSPVADMPGDGGGAAGTSTGQGPGTGEAAMLEDKVAVPSVETSSLPVEKPLPVPPNPAMEKVALPRPPRPVVEKVTLPAPPKPVPVEKPLPAPPKPAMEKVALPAPPKPVPVEKPLPASSKPVVKKVEPAPPKPPPDAMTLAHKATKRQPSVPTTATASDVQQKVATLRTRQAQPELVETSVASEAQQKVLALREQQTRQEAAAQAAAQRLAGLRAEQAAKQAAEQRIAALRSRVSSGAGTGSGSGGGGGSSGSDSQPGGGRGTTGVGAGGAAPGGGRGSGTAGSGGFGTGGLAGIRLREYQERVGEKIRQAWKVPPQSQGLQAVVFLVITRSGQVEQLRLIQHSGNLLFDESLQQAVRQAQPLPALPDDYSGGFLEVELRFRPRG